MIKKIIDDEITKQVSDLIKIKINTTDIPKYTKQLNTVLSAVEVLQELNTTNVLPTLQTHGLSNITRDDKVIHGLDLIDYKNRQNIHGDYFVVKKVI